MNDLLAAKTAFETLTGCDSQSVGGLGFCPVVVVAWWVPTSTTGTTRGNRGGIGFWTPDASVSVAWASADGETTTRTAQLGADAALVGLEGPEHGIAMRADVASFDENGLTLEYATQPSTPWLVHALALGGAAVEGGRVGWGSAKSLVSPDAGFVLTAPGPMEMDIVTRHLRVGIGVECSQGRAAAGYVCRDAARPGDSRGAQESRTSALDWPNDAPGSNRVCYLRVDGVHARVGATVSPIGEGATHTWLGFRPDALLLFSWGLPRSLHWKNTGRLCLGGAAGGRSGCAGWDDRDGELRTTMTHARSSTELALMVADSQSDELHAHASLAAVDDRGFTLDWLSDRPGRECIYVALSGRDPALQGFIPRLRGLVRRLQAR